MFIRQITPSVQSVLEIRCRYIHLFLVKSDFKKLNESNWTFIVSLTSAISPLSHAPSALFFTCPPDVLRLFSFRSRSCHSHLPHNHLIPLSSASPPISPPAPHSLISHSLHIYRPRCLVPLPDRQGCHESHVFAFTPELEPVPPYRAHTWTCLPVSL